VKIEFHPSIPPQNGNGLLKMILGLDPGTHGALAALKGSDVVLLEDLPTHTLSTKGRGDRAELDIYNLHAMIVELGPIEHAFVERVTARPGNGSVSMFRFGQAVGAISATLAVMGIPTTYVQPKVWQRYHGIGPTPDAARQRAVQLYPQTAPGLRRKADGNRADALLIASYGQRMLAKPNQITQIAERHYTRREDVGAAAG
jgi:crossover junction endodeoxyribonuclease RuvC